MSRIGNAPISIPEGVEINLSAENVVNVKGKLGELSESIDPQIKVNIEEGQIKLSRPNDEKDLRSKHVTSKTIYGWNRLITCITQYINNCACGIGTTSI